MQQVHRTIEPQNYTDEQKLIFMLGEELKRPLTSIKALAESSGDSAIQLEARKALRTVDNVLFYQKIANNQIKLELTTVHVGSTLTQVANNLKPLSLEKGCETEINIQNGLATAHADPQALRSGLESLWQAVLAMTAKPSPLNWHVYRTGNTIKLAVVNNSIDLSQVKIANNSNIGLSAQPYSGVAGPATDLATAYSIFTVMNTKLTKVRKGGLNGLSISLPISSQLALV